MRTLVTAMACMLLACSRDRTPDAKPEGAQWACSADGDCTLSCAWGAVNEKWYRATQPNECKDGCRGKGMRARCQAGSCVAFDGNQDKIDSACTHLTKPLLDE